MSTYTDYTKDTAKRTILAIFYRLSKNHMDLVV